MITRTYVGTIREDKYAYRTNEGYVTGLELDCESGGTVNLGTSEYSSIFTSMVGQRICLTVQDLPFLEEGE